MNDMIGVWGDRGVLLPGNFFLFFFFLAFHLLTQPNVLLKMMVVEQNYRENFEGKQFFQLNSSVLRFS